MENQIEKYIEKWFPSSNSKNALLRRRKQRIIRPWIFLTDCWDSLYIHILVLLLANMFNSAVLTREPDVWNCPKGLLIKRGFGPLFLRYFYTMSMIIISYDKKGPSFLIEQWSMTPWSPRSYVLLFWNSHHSSIMKTCKQI